MGRVKGLFGAGEERQLVLVLVDEQREHVVARGACRVCHGEGMLEQSAHGYLYGGTVGYRETPFIPN